MEAEPLSQSVSESFTWRDIFSEGEKRIQKKFLDTVLLTNPRDRARLLAQRETVQRRIARALETDNTALLRRALNEQVKLLARLA